MEGKPVLYGTARHPGDREYPEDEYEDYPSYIVDRPQDWYKTMIVRYIGGSDEDIQNQSSVYGDPERVFNVGETYVLIDYSRVLYHEGEHLVGIQIYGLPEYYNPKFFTSDIHEDKNYNIPFKIYLEFEILFEFIFSIFFSCTKPIEALSSLIL